MSGAWPRASFRTREREAAHLRDHETLARFGQAAILAGEVTFVFVATTANRAGPAPEVPTMIEAGLPGFEIVLYSGILAPKGMDRAGRALQRRVRQGRPGPAEEIAKLGPVVKASGAKLD